MSGQGQIPPVVLPPERYSQSSELACFNVYVPCDLRGKVSLLGTLITLRIVGHFCTREVIPMRQDVVFMPKERHSKVL